MDRTHQVKVLKWLLARKTWVPNGFSLFGATDLGWLCQNPEVTLPPTIALTLTLTLALTLTLTLTPSLALTLTLTLTLTRSTASRHSSSGPRSRATRPTRARCLSWWGDAP